MRFRIIYYSEEVQDEIDSWPVSNRAVYARITELMEKHGPNLGRPYTKALSDGLFEIIAKTGRAFYCMEVERKIVILHAFIKKTQRTPKRHLDTARKRMKKYKN